MENICKVNLGDVYYPRDNSWAINIETCKDALSLVPFGTTSPEQGTIYTIVKLPYFESIFALVYDNGKIRRRKITRQFVNIKSSNTGNIYRVLYFEPIIKKN